MKPLSERPLLLLLAGVQFTHIMDFMVMMPLGPQVMRDLSIGPGQFSALVAAYTISSGLVGLLAAPFIDRFDRRTLLLVVYAGFILGTINCAVADTAATLLTARILSGGFGGLSMTMVMAIVSDVVPAARRASAIGIVMTAFSAAAALGVPFGLALAQRFRWEAPFFLLAGLAAIMWLVAAIGVPSVRGHVQDSAKARTAAFMALLRDVNAGRAILFLAANAFGHFAIIPLMPQYWVSNVGYPEQHLSLLYLVGGVLTVFTAPRVGRLADQFGRHRVYTVLVGLASVVTLAVANAGPMPMWGVLVLSSSFFIFASGRFIPAQTIVTLAVPPSRRGAFMSLSGCARDLASGLAASVGGWMVSEDTAGRLTNFHWLGWLAVGASLLALWLASRVRVNEGVAPAAQSAEECTNPSVVHFAAASDAAQTRGKS